MSAGSDTGGTADASRGAVIDLRSDTVTRPGPEMRRAIAEAEVGDDLLGDDPTVKRLETRIAEILGTEGSLFFPSGTMANQTALATQGVWGSEVVIEEGAHILHFEEGAAAALSGLQLRTVRGERGVIPREKLAAAIRPDSRFVPRTSLVCLENTHLASGGTVVSPEASDAMAEVARERGLPVHLDGARLWHAAAATGRPITDFTRCADTVMVCLSKGLGAPVGSMLAASEETLERAWRIRRRFGGAMRQSGLLAAAGLHALDHHRTRLVEDHANAKALAEAFRAIPGLRVVEPETNVVIATSEPGGPDPVKLVRDFEAEGVLILPFGPRGLRAVTHLDVDAAAIRRVADLLRGWPSE
ncbi:MAG: GntG family PLP-dependent aldolase [Longimicrobiales bacterium]|nr:GntG family PLP-dependent aldolase [Longimicrobiales bacterium]